MLSKYKFNQLLAVGVSTVFVSLFLILLNFDTNWVQYSIIFVALIACEHYMLNLVHIASHRGISKSLWLNDLLGNMVAILSGVTLPVFRTTHNLHHSNPNNPTKDPDHFISTKGGLWWISVRVIYHDYYFFKNKLYKPKGYLTTYFFDRLIQFILVSLFALNGKFLVWQNFWLPSMLIIGTLYGFFQFYFPHFSTEIVDKWKTLKNPNFIQRFVLFLVNFSNYYHFKHHQQITNNLHYFPFWSYYLDRFKLNRRLPELIKEVNY